MKNLRFLCVALPTLCLALQLFAAKGMISRADVAAYLRVRAATEKDAAITMQDFIYQYGDHAEYSVEKVKVYSPSPRVASLPERQKKSGFQGFKTLLRKDSGDVLSSEDPRLKDEGEGKKKFDDLEGATFSFARDYNTNFNTWTAQGALIFPLVWENDVVLQEGDFYKLRTFGVIPSISVHRVENNRPDGTEEISLVTPRVGLFGKWISGGTVEAITLRAFASYARDAENDIDVVAGEFELEPHIFGGKYFRIGYNTILWPTTDPDNKAASLLSYQLRLILHGEIGSYEGTGQMPMSDSEYDFVRLGPQVHLDLDPLFSQRLSLKLTYEYLPAVRGHNQNDSLLTADIEFLLTEPKKSPRMSLKSSYLNGGLDLTKERAHTLLIGLGAAF